MNLYFVLMNLLGYGAFTYLLSKNEITVETFSFWALLVIVMVLQLLPVIYLMDRQNKG